VITEEVPGDYIKIKTKDGKVVTYKMDEILKRTKEEVVIKEEVVTKKDTLKKVESENLKKQPFAKNSLTIQPIGLLTLLTNIEYDRALSNGFSVGLKISFMTFFARGFVEFEGNKSDVDNAEAMKESLSAWGIGSHIRIYTGSRAVEGFFLGLAFEKLSVNYDEVEGTTVKKTTNRTIGLVRLEFEIGNRIKLSSKKGGFTILWTLGAGVGFLNGIGKKGDESSTIPIGSIGFGLGYSF
jgi:hypothetical protein